jgi:hypothetical protein
MRGHAGIRDALVVDHVLDDLLFVELRDAAAAEELARILAPEWIASVQPWDHSWIVAVDLRPGPDDLALLLRAIERWATERGFWSVPFRLDGRDYEMEIDAANVPAAV